MAREPPMDAPQIAHRVVQMLDHVAKRRRVEGRVAGLKIRKRPKLQGYPMILRQRYSGSVGLDALRIPPKPTGEGDERAGACAHVEQATARLVALMPHLPAGNRCPQRDECR